MTSTASSHPAQDASHLLAQARLAKVRISELPPPIRPATETDAYACQRNLVAKLCEQHHADVIGYKIACTNALAQQQLSVSGPFYGQLLSSFCYTSPARLDSSKFDMRLIEAEFAFRIARDLRTSGGPVSRRELEDSIDAVVPGIELVDSRYDSWTTVGVHSLIADNACNAGWVKGAPVSDWKSSDLAAQEVRLFVNGSLKQQGNGAAVLGHPLNALQWLVDKLQQEGGGLKAGQYVTTGVTTGVYEAVRGDHIEADFGPFGRVEVTFE